MNKIKEIIREKVIEFKGQTFSNSKDVNSWIERAFSSVIRQALAVRVEAEKEKDDLEKKIVKGVYTSSKDIKKDLEEYNRIEKRNKKLDL